MKKLFPVFFIAGFTATACNSLQQDKVRDFIPGVYVKEINQEFAKGMDTLIIETLDEAAGSYTIIRRSGYQQMIDGRKLTPKNEVHKWTAVFDGDTKQLKEQNKGRVFTFSPEQNILTMGSSEYRKIETQ
jgi:hypothetical protein